MEGEGKRWSLAGAEASLTLRSLQLDFGHLGMEPLSIRQGRACAGQKFGEVW
jgi:hypothetical protein